MISGTDQQKGGRRMGRIAIPFLPILLAFAATVGGLRAADTLSDQRILKIRGWLLENVRQYHPDSQRRALTQAVEQRAVQAGIPREPSDEALPADWPEKQAMAAAEAAAKVRFPDKSAAVLEQEAQAKYPLVKPGDTITITYRPNPTREDTVTDVFRGYAGGVLVIGTRRIQEKDVVTQNASPAVFQFNEVQCAKIRAAYIARGEADQKYNRTLFFEAEQARLLPLQEAEWRRRNEAAGFIWFYDRWQTLNQTVQELLLQELPRLREIANAKPAEALSAPRPLPVTPTALPAVRPPAVPTPTTAVAPTPVKPEPPPAPPVTPMAVTATAFASPAPAPAATGTKAVARPRPEPAAVKPPPPPGRTTAHVPIWRKLFQPVLFATGGLLFAIGLAAVVILRKNGDPNRAQSRFVATMAEAEKEVWNPLSADEPTLPVVAVSFRDGECARRALTRLSFILPPPPGGDRPDVVLASRKPIVVGDYEIDGGAHIAMVAGNALNHAAWEEAKIVLGEAEGALEVQCGAPPPLDIELPDVATLHGGAALVTPAGGPAPAPGCFADYCYFAAPTRQAAIVFLKHAVIRTADAHVVVFTPEGNWGRDLRGIYEE